MEDKFLNCNDAILASTRNVLENGDCVKVKSQLGEVLTKEIQNERISIPMNECVFSVPERKINERFMVNEAYWICSGSLYVNDIVTCEHIKKYSDDGYIFNGAYGPMFLSQLEFVANELIKDNNTRRAVLTIWHPNPISTKDYKCTLTFVFNIRNGLLNTTVLMRSNDLFLGRPYDLFNFSTMSFRLLCRLRESGLNPELGFLTLNSVSAHIYESDYSKIEDILKSKRTKYSCKPIWYKCKTWKEASKKMVKFFNS